MEASQALKRRLIRSLTRSLQCQCNLSTAPRPRTLRHGAAPSSKKSPPSSSRPLSTTAQSSKEGPSSSSPTQSAKEAVKSYTSSVQKIIDGYQLKDKMTSRQYEQLQTTVANAEVLLDAPRQSYEAFGPLLSSLKGEIDPILRRQFGTSNLPSITTKIPSPSSPPSTSPSLQNSTPETPKPSISSSLDSVFPKAPRRSPNLTPSSDFPYDGIANLLNQKIDQSAKDTVTDLFRPGSRSPFNKLNPSMPPSQYLSRSDRDMHKRTMLDSEFNRNEQTMYASLPNKHSTRETLRLKPSLGRTVISHYNFDLTRAFRTLESLCSRNGVRRDMNSQKFHVRRGQKKKDLRISRWREMFSKGFLAECARVRRMRKQGW